MYKAGKGQAGGAALVEKQLGASPSLGLQCGQRDGRASQWGRPRAVGWEATHLVLLVLEGMALGFE